MGIHTHFYNRSRTMFKSLAAVALAATAVVAKDDPRICADIKKAELLSVQVSEFQLKTSEYLDCKNGTHPDHHHHPLHDKLCHALEISEVEYKKLFEDTKNLYSKHCNKENYDDYKELCIDLYKEEELPMALKDLQLLTAMYEHCFEHEKFDEVEKAVCKDLAACAENGLETALIFNSIFDKICI